jgi:hypothetical protein
MKYNKEECEKMYQEFISLKREIDDVFQVHDMTPGRKIEAKLAPPIEKFERRDFLKNEIALNCKDCLALKPGEWFEIE